MREELQMPTTLEGWLSTAEEFEKRWNLPHCVGAIDGKHVRIWCPANGVSANYNYKQFHSLILLAVVDANYAFTYIDIGGKGASGDAQIWNDTLLKREIQEGNLKLSPPKPLPGDDQPFGYFFVGDDAFGLQEGC